MVKLIGSVLSELVWIKYIILCFFFNNVWSMVWLIVLVVLNIRMCFFMFGVEVVVDVVMLVVLKVLDWFWGGGLGGVMYYGFFVLFGVLSYFRCLLILFFYVWFRVCCL